MSKRKIDDDIDVRKRLETLCTSDAISVDSLREIIDAYPLPKENENVAYHSSFFHRACFNKNVTLEIIEYLLDVYPGAVGINTTYFCPNGESSCYPLHLCCYNENCPNTVIKLILEKYPDAISEFAMVKHGVNRGEYDTAYVEGLPIHYYLSRTSNLDLDTVKVLVDAYPNCLMNADGEMEFYPIHALLYNPNVSNLQDVLAYLMEYKPASVYLADGRGMVSLHIVCRSKGVTLEVFQLIYNAWPEGVLQRDNIGNLPIHELCSNENVDEDTWFDIFHIMMNADYSIVRERDDDGELPIHKAAASQSVNVCKTLIDLYPESLREMDNGSLPIHEACRWGSRDDTLDTIQHMLDLEPESINARDTRHNDGLLPIHCAAQNGKAKTVEFLLSHDPHAASKETTNRWLPFHLACVADDEHVDKVQLLFDAYPDVILTLDQDGNTPIDSARSKCNWRVVQLLEAQLAYAEKARDATAMTTLDESGWLPLHHALKDDVSLGSIKLLVRGNPLAVRTADNNMAFPLHIACEFSSAKVVKFLVEKFGRPVDHCDGNNDSILHYACRGGRCEVVKYLLESHAHLVASATVNAKNEQPIHLLCESSKDEDGDSESTEYIETIWQLLLANPEVVMA